MPSTKRPQCQECIAGEEPVDHRLQTCDGIEALLGYLYLKKEWKRMLELVKIGLDSILKEQ